MRVTVEDHLSFVQNLCTVSSQAIDRQNTFDAGATIGPGMNEIGITVRIPKGTGIDPTLCLLDQEWRGPRPGGIFRLGHVDTKIRIRIEDVETLFVVANRRGPNAMAMLRRTKHVTRNLLLKNMTDDAPVHQILGVQNW